MKQIEKVNVGFFKSNVREIINENDIETVLSDGWVIKSVDKHEIDISKYKPLRGSSYLPLPHFFFLLNKMPSGQENIKNI